MASIINLGNLYLDDHPVETGIGYISGQAIDIGDAASGLEISWIPVNGLLIADRCLLTNISWDDLDAQGLVFGKEIMAQGFRFKIRLLKVGCGEGVPNEWDAALDTVGEDNDLWHWDGKYFWGQESMNRYASRRARRGYHSARSWSCYSQSNRRVSLGFRPALEFLPSDTSDLRFGQEIMAIGRNGCVMGTLMEKTQYDLILQPKPGGVAGEAAFAASMQDGTLAVDRSGIVSIATT